MILSYFNDSHIRASRPSCRKDEKYYENQLVKLREAITVEADVRLHGGDLFHIFNSPISLLYDVFPIFSGQNLLVNPGNHDIFGATTETIRRSGLGLLASSGFGKLLEAADHDLGKNIRVRSAPYQLNYPEDFYWIKNKKPGDIWVVLAHDMLTTRPVPFPHRQIKELKTNADVIFCSHWHSQFMEKVGNTWFINSGPLDCQTITERHTKPAVALLDISSKGIVPKFRYLKTTGYEEIEVPDEIEKDLGLADDFIKQVQSSGLADGGDMEALVKNVASESGYTDACIQRVLERLKMAQACVEEV